MNLREFVNLVELRPSDIVILTNGKIGLQLASKWLSRIEADRTLTNPVELLIERLCAEKQHALGHSIKMTKHQIVKLAKPLTDVSGIYFLVDGSEIVYVGQSLNVYARIAAHKDKKFEKVFVIKCDAENLLKIESQYIKLFTPKYNNQLNPHSWLLPKTKTNVPAKIIHHAQRCNDLVNPGLYKFIKSKNGFLYFRIKRGELLRVEIGCDAIKVNDVYYAGDFSKTVGEIYKVIIID